MLSDVIIVISSDRKKLSLLPEKFHHNNILTVWKITYTGEREIFKISTIFSYFY